MELSCPQFRRSLGSSLVEEVTWLWSGRGVDAPQSPGPSSQGPAASVGTIYDCLSLLVSCMVYGISHCGSLWLDNQASTLLRLPQLLPMVADDHRNLFFFLTYTSCFLLPSPAFSAAVHGGDHQSCLPVFGLAAFWLGLRP